METTERRTQRQSDDRVAVAQRSDGWVAVFFVFFVLLLLLESETQLLLAVCSEVERCSMRRPRCLFVCRMCPLWICWGQLRFLLLWIIGHFVLRGELCAHAESSLPPLFSLLRCSFGWWQPHVAGHPAVERTNEQTKNKKKKCGCACHEIKHPSWLTWSRRSRLETFRQGRGRKFTFAGSGFWFWLHGQLTLKWIFSYPIW